MKVPFGDISHRHRQHPNDATAAGEAPACLVEGRGAEQWGRDPKDAGDVGRGGLARGHELGVSAEDADRLKVNLAGDRGDAVALLRAPVAGAPRVRDRL